MIYVGDGKSLSISHIGEVSINTQDRYLNLKDVLVVPNLKKNLLSIRKLTTDICVPLNSLLLTLLLRFTTPG